MTPAHYIFIDHENVSVTDADIELLVGKPAHLTLVLGEHKPVPPAVVEKLWKLRGQVEVVRNSQPGKNALDFILILHLGKRQANAAGGQFHIIAKDKDYNIVLQHFREQGWSAFQHDSLSLVPCLRSPAKPLRVSHTERLDHLLKVYGSGQPKPKKKQGLENQIQSYFANSLTPEELKALVQGLIDAKIIKIGGDQKITFIEKGLKLPSATAIQAVPCHFPLHRAA